MKKTCFYTIYDNNNEPYAVMLRNSLKKFHPDIELREFADKEIDESGIPRPDIFYLSAPFFAKKLMDEGYEHVIKMDCDQIITGNLDHVIEDTSFDVGTVLNFNERDFKTYGPVGVWDIPPQQYFNNGMVSLNSKEFVEHWLKVCMTPHFMNYTYKEQDFLNIICHYGNYNVFCFDQSNKWHGLASKSHWLQAVMKEGKLVVPLPEGDREIVCLHWAGGNQEKKMNYQTAFTEEVISYLDSLVK